MVKKILTRYVLKMVSGLSGIRAWIATKLLYALIDWLEKNLSYTIEAIKEIWIRKRNKEQAEKDAAEYYEKVIKDESDKTQKEIDDETSQALNGPRI